MMKLHHEIIFMLLQENPVNLKIGGDDAWRLAQ